jgi:short-subunit dehydrogenase
MTTRTTASRLLPIAASIGGLLAVRAFFRKRRADAFELAGKVVLITGGSRGLGLVMARQLAEQGAKLAICARHADQLQRAEDELRSRGAEVLALACDLTERTDAERLITEVTDHYGRIDVLINNAGIIQGGPLENMEVRDFEDAMNTNFYAALYTSLAVLPQMRERRAGRIVNISSIGGKVSVPHLLPYSASKFALRGFSQGLRAEVARDGIQVTTVFPGLLQTGSPRNTIVKGQHEKEYTWFKIADSLPFLSAAAEEAAAQIIQGLREGRSEVVITLPAKLMGILNELFPGFITRSFDLVNRLLPDPVPGSTERRFGYESETAASRSFLTRTTDRAAVRNNEL